MNPLPPDSATAAGLIPRLAPLRSSPPACSRPACPQEVLPCPTAAAGTDSGGPTAPAPPAASRFCKGQTVQLAPSSRPELPWVVTCQAEAPVTQHVLVKLLCRPHITALCSCSPELTAVLLGEAPRPTPSSPRNAEQPPWGSEAAWGNHSPWGHS